MSEPAGHLLELERPADVVAPGEGVDRAPAAATPGRTRRMIGEVVLTTTALIGVAMTGVTVAATVNGIRPLVVRSGSMAPAIPRGSMVVVRRVDAAEVDIGDIVAVERPDRIRVTHRVIAVEHQGEVAELTLKGDANEDPDPAPVVVRSTHRLVWHLPLVGRAAAWLATAPGGFLIGSLATWAVCRLNGRRPVTGRRPR